MEIPAKVSVYNPTLGIKGQQGTLIAVNEAYYEVYMELKDNFHSVLLPIAETVLIFNEPIPVATIDFELER